MIDFDRIAPKLYQGAWPCPHVHPPLSLLREGFQVLVLCAEELQTPAAAYPGVVVVHAPLDDGRLDDRQLHIASQAAQAVVACVRQGWRVLTTCAQGRNRSGLVNGIALQRLTKLPGADCRRRIQAARPGALTNPHFARYLDQLAGFRPFPLHR